MTSIPFAMAVLRGTAEVMLDTGSLSNAVVMENVVPYPLVSDGTPLPLDDSKFTETVISDCIEALQSHQQKKSYQKQESLPAAFISSCTLFRSCPRRASFKGI